MLLKQKASLSVLIHPELPNIEDWTDKFDEAINDDLNVPQALALVWEIFKEPRSAIDKLAFISYADEVLGLDLLKEETPTEEALPAELTAVLEKRKAARQNKDFKLSDELRVQIDALGYTVKDTPGGQKVTKK